MQAKKNKKKIVVHTTQPRAVRLRRAKVWLESYAGKKLVRAYAKKYGVDLLCAIAGLRMLGVEIKAEYEQAVRNTIQQQLEQKRLKKLEKEEIEDTSGYKDWDFAFIAGYTSGGAPYGIRQEDILEENDN
ncbi:hypothetical protein [Pedobacter sp. MR22-3]|uniref:hypothetical protein n=1 Tax=Pedobacter sp. MR22-3 TaxID=2994552 RepID=UPI002245F17D|nr:hypothetical protein [Pedobacter sp. MR22-3]